MKMMIRGEVINLWLTNISLLAARPCCLFVHLLSCQNNNHVDDDDDDEKDGDEDNLYIRRAVHLYHIC